MTPITARNSYSRQEKCSEVEARKLHSYYRVARLSELYWSIKSVQQRPELQLKGAGIIYSHCFFLSLLSLFTVCPLLLTLSYMLPLARKCIFEVVARLWKRELVG